MNDFATTNLSTNTSPAREDATPISRISNVFSVDLEDWHTLIYRRITGGDLASLSTNVLRQTDRLLRLLDLHGVKATFFTLGSLAAQHKRLIQRIAKAGHEIACHSYDHNPVYQMTPETFREDTRRAKETLEDVTASRIVGYRAPEFSVTASSLWALEVLADLGFKYDSSIFPIRHRRYGIPGFPPSPQRYMLPGGAEITEVPLSTIDWKSFRFPVAGGGYFRCLPQQAIHHAIQRLNRAAMPLVTYFHPYEFDSRSLDIFETFAPRKLKQRLRCMQINAHQNIGRHSVYAKVDGLLNAYSFTTFERYLTETNLASTRSLLRSSSPQTDLIFVTP